LFRKFRKVIITVDVVAVVKTVDVKKVQVIANYNQNRRRSSIEKRPGLTDLCAILIRSDKKSKKRQCLFTNLFDIFKYYFSCKIVVSLLK